MAKHIVLIHGRHFKPEEKLLKKDWIDALSHGISRDYDNTTLDRFKKVKKTMVYYGDLSNAFLGKKTASSWTKKRAAKDVADRKLALAKLKQYGSGDFNQTEYKKISDLMDALKGVAADMISGPLSLFGIGDEIVSLVAPDMEHYWHPDYQFGSEVRWRLTTVLEKALKAGDDIMLISHSLGTIVSYDVLWKFSHYGEYQHLRGKVVNHLVTLGSPLGDENVKKQLKGASASGARCYPHNIGHWLNLAAKDDYISHDPTIANDFKKMLKLKLVSSITDEPVYNMSLRGGNSNPHHGAGYLIHPEMSRRLSSWLG